MNEMMVCEGMEQPFASWEGVSIPQGIAAVKPGHPFSTHAGRTVWVLCWVGYQLSDWSRG